MGEPQTKVVLNPKKVSKHFDAKSRGDAKYCYLLQKIVDTNLGFKVHFIEYEVLREQMIYQQLARGIQTHYNRCRDPGQSGDPLRKIEVVRQLSF